MYKYIEKPLNVGQGRISINYENYEVGKTSCRSSVSGVPACYFFLISAHFCGNITQLPCCGYIRASGSWVFIWI